jgi:pimeloyl-ACP methyl ester carboxylesterase
MAGLAAFFGRFLDRLEVDRYRLVIHDWGSIALIAARDHPDRVTRLVSFNSVPLTGAYRWHPIARLAWRRRGLGELFNLFATGPGARPISEMVARRSGQRSPLPAEYVKRVTSRWDRGTSRAILELYRSADPPALAAAGAGRGTLDCPALVAWAQADPYLGPRFGRELAGALPHARLLEIERAGHWPWLDRPDLVGTTLDFLAEA